MKRWFLIGTILGVGLFAKAWADPLYPFGDVNGDGKVDVADAQLVLGSAVGLRPLSISQRAAADVAPPTGLDGRTVGDGVIDLRDVVQLLRFVVGVVSAPQFYPPIYFTHVAELDQFDPLQGHVRLTDLPTGQYQVVLYLFIPGSGAWRKPYLDDRRFIPIQPNGDWTTLYATGGIDQKATKIAAFLTRSGYDPPLCANGCPELPPELFTRPDVLANTIADRPISSVEVTFAGMPWRVKSAPLPIGPGPNVFGAENVAVDPAGALHLRIRKSDTSNAWSTAEVISERSLGYGTYSFTVSTPLAALPPSVILGMFLYDDESEGAAEAHFREIDLEAGRFNDPNRPDFQYTVQPYTTPGNQLQFELPDSMMTTHSIDWRSDRILFQSRVGPTVTRQWEYHGPDLPRPGKEKVHINLWLFQVVPPADQQPVEIVIGDFTYQPQ